MASDQSCRSEKQMCVGGRALSIKSAGGPRRELVLPRVDFERRVSVAHADDLLEVRRQECRDRARALVLVHVTQLVRKEPDTLLTAAHEHGVTECEARHAGA